MLGMLIIGEHENWMEDCSDSMSSCQVYFVFSLLAAAQCGPWAQLIPPGVTGDVLNTRTGRAQSTQRVTRSVSAGPRSAEQRPVTSSDIRCEEWHLRSRVCRVSEHLQTVSVFRVQRDLRPGLKLGWTIWCLARLLWNSSVKLNYTWCNRETRLKWSADLLFIAHLKCFEIYAPIKCIKLHTPQFSATASCHMQYVVSCTFIE